MRRFIKYVLAGLGLYVLYNIVGMVLISAKVVDEWVVFPDYVLVDEQEAHPGTDGPHIFYRDSLIIVKSVVPVDTGYVGVTDTFVNRKAITVQCRFDEHPDWNFTTTLKDSLQPGPSIYPAADSIIAISDIEGEFGAFRQLLIANHVMNTNYEWTFGTGHLVLVGDFVDRGVNVTETLWLIYHLEQEAQKTGGNVQYILGNHEIMNMSNNLKYVHGKYIENTYLVKENYKQWFKPGTELGRWLATKNIIERTGDILFCHAGISQETLNLSLCIPEINNLCRPYYFTEQEQRPARLGAELDVLFSSETSPFWYRGVAKEEVPGGLVDMTLEQFSARYIVHGHTVVDEVAKLYNGKVIAIDTKHAKGISQGLLYKQGIFYRIDSRGKRNLL